MFKSILSAMLAISIFLFAGCYDVVSLSRDDYKTVNQYDQVNVLMDTSGTLTKYRFSKGMCVVQNDTLIGTGTMMSDGGQQDNVNVSIPTSNISLIEVSKLNLAQTMTVAGAAILVSVGAFFLSGAPGATGGAGQHSTPTAQ